MDHGSRDIGHFGFRDCGYSRPFAALGNVFAVFWREMTRDAIRPYRPELHYMRGPGPAWRAKHGLPAV